VTGAPTLLFGVGATKAGTTWLYQHLAGHPDCHLRKIKELHYFDALETGSLARQVTIQQQHLDGPGRKTQARRRDLLDWIAVLERGVEDLPAYLGYLTAGAGRKRLVADITPAYALLPEARLRAMAGLLPDVRFLYLLRDPVARLWSQVRMMASRAAASARDTSRLARRFLARLLSGEAPPDDYRLDYAGAIRRLGAAVAPERLLIGFTDEVISAEGIGRLWAFLGIGPGPAAVAERVFPGVPLAITAAQAKAAREFLAPQYAFVEAHFGRLPASWRRSPAEMAA
jgi:hypothetical protein